VICGLPRKREAGRRSRVEPASEACALCGQSAQALILAGTFRPPVQPHGASDSFARKCNVDRAEAALIIIALPGLMRKGQANV
jgi:hypothetical protein